MGFEPSTRILIIAEERAIQVVEGVTGELPFADARFDFALMVTTTCFMDDVDVAVRKVRRVLKNFRRFIVGFIDKSSVLDRLYEKGRRENVAEA